MEKRYFWKFYYKNGEIMNFPSFMSSQQLIKNYWRLFDESKEGTLVYWNISTKVIRTEWEPIEDL